MDVRRQLGGQQEAVKHKQEVVAKFWDEGVEEGDGGMLEEGQLREMRRCR